MRNVKFTRGLLAGIALVPVFASPQSHVVDRTTSTAERSLTVAEAALRAQVEVLASDEMQGRKPGTEGYANAAAYVVKQMQAAGLQPAGEDNGWYQKVPLVETSTIGTPQMTINGQPLVFNTDFATFPTPGLPGIELDAPVVFVGYGVVDPATGRDDYGGLDVRGKIVALFATGPRSENSEVAAHQAYVFDRTRTAEARGAVGVILLHTKQWDPMVPFDFIKHHIASNQSTWSDGDGSQDLGAPRIGLLSVSGAAKLFAGSGSSWQDIREAEDAGRPVPLGPLEARLATQQQYESVQVIGLNVVGKLPGSDPQLASQTIVLSAHLDHVGKVTPVDGDEIANGAVDNAIGVATILEVARLFHTNGDKPRRSILFLAVTAEESGLTGSDYFVQHPTVPAADIVANINVDCPVLTYQFQDVIAYGAERSTIGSVVKSVVAAEEIELTPDPMPEQVIFTRSDHYHFVRIGVPVVILYPGLKGPGAAAQRDYFTQHYHMPSDDLSLPFDWTAAVEFVRLYYLIAKPLADASDRPRWLKGDYFGERYMGPMTQD